MRVVMAGHLSCFLFVPCTRKLTKAAASGHIKNERPARRPAFC